MVSTSNTAQVQSPEAVTKCASLWVQQQANAALLCASQFVDSTRDASATPRTQAGSGARLARQLIWLGVGLRCLPLFESASRRMETRPSSSTTARRGSRSRRSLNCMPSGGGGAKPPASACSVCWPDSVSQASRCAACRLAMVCSCNRAAAVHMDMCVRLCESTTGGSQASGKGARW